MAAAPSFQGRALSEAAIRALADDLEGLNMGPVLLRLSRQELEKRFERI